MDEKSFTRKLSLSDITYAASGYRFSHDNQLICQLVVEGRGEIAEPALQQAARDLALSCPALRSRLKGFWIAKYWTSRGPLPRVRTLYREWDGHCQPGLEFIDTPLDLIRGPVAEIVQVIGRATYIVFRVHHAVTDGVGLMEFSRAFFNVLNGKSVDAFDSKVRLEDLPGGNIEAIPASVLDAAIPYTLRSSEADTGDSDVSLDRSRHWRLISVPGADNKILMKVMLAIAEQARGDSKQAVRINMPVSLRRHIPQERSLANLIGMLRIDIAPGDDFKILLTKIKQAMAQKQELPIAVNSLTSKLAFVLPFMLLRLLEKKAIQALLSRPRFRCSGTASHIGHVDLEAYSNDVFTAKRVYGIPVPPLGTPLMAVMVNNHKSTEIVVSANRTLISDHTMDELVERLQSLIDGYGKHSMSTHRNAGSKRKSRRNSL